MTLSAPRCEQFSRERSPRKTMSFENRSKDKYTDIFSRQIEAIAFIILKIFCNVRKKCLRTAYCLLRGTFSFEFSGTTLWTKKYFPSSG